MASRPTLPGWSRAQAMKQTLRPAALPWAAPLARAARVQMQGQRRRRINMQGWRAPLCRALPAERGAPARCRAGSRAA